MLAAELGSPKALQAQVTRGHLWCQPNIKSTCSQSPLGAPATEQEWKIQTEGRLEWTARPWTKLFTLQSVQKRTRTMVHIQTKVTKTNKLDRWGWEKMMIIFSRTLRQRNTTECRQAAFVHIRMLVPARNIKHKTCLNRAPAAHCVHEHCNRTILSS